MKQWTSDENEIIGANAALLTSSQIADLLESRTAKSVRHQAAKLNIKLTGYLKSLGQVRHSKQNIELALELRGAGFTRAIIASETGLGHRVQLYYEGRHVSGS